PVRLAVDRVDHVDKSEDFDLEAGFLADFAGRRLTHGFADFLRAARDAPGKPARQLAAHRQQHFIAAEHDDPDSDIGAVGIGPRVHRLLLAHAERPSFPATLTAECRHAGAAIKTTGTPEPPARSRRSGRPGARPDR